MRSEKKMRVYTASEAKGLTQYFILHQITRLNLYVQCRCTYSADVHKSEDKNFPERKSGNISFQGACKIVFKLEDLGLLGLIASTETFISIQTIEQNEIIRER